MCRVEADQVFLFYFILCYRRKRQESYEKELLEYLDGCARAEVE